MKPTMEDSFNRTIVKSVETLTTKAVAKDITGADSVSDDELKAFKFNSYAAAPPMGAINSFLAVLR